MTETLNETARGSRLKNTLIILGSYTLIYCVICAAAFGVFLHTGKSLVSIYDAYDQGYFWTVELKKNLAAFLDGGGYPTWSWSKGPGLEVKGITDPFAIIAAAFPAGMTELGYSVAILARLYFSGLAFAAFAKEIGLGNFQAVLGGVSYTFSAWIINVAMIQAQFINITTLLPILMLSVDRVYKGKSPLPFILTVAATMISSIYLAYMVGIIAVVYILLRYFAYCGKAGFIDYIRRIGLFMVYGLLGIAVSAVMVVGTVQVLMGASTGQEGVSYDTFSGMKFFESMGNTFLSKGERFPYGYLGVPAAVLMVVFAGFRRFSFRRTNLIMLLILTAMMPFPFFSSMFNGFGYVTSRWYFIVLFFLIWTAAEAFDPDKLADVPGLIITGLGLCLIVFSTLGLAYLDVIGSYTESSFRFVCISIAAAAVVYVILLTGIKGFVPLKFRQTAIIAVLTAALAFSWSGTMRSYGEHFVDQGQIDRSLKASTQRAGAMIEDDSFYRIDQVDGINIDHNAEQPANENLWWGTKTLYLYDSKVPSRLSEFNRIMGNNYGYSKRVYVLSNGQRMGLDFLYGVKYFLGDDEVKGKYGSDEFAGYGFSKYKTLDGVHVLKNKYASGLGFAYDRVIPESEFLKLSRNAREQAILQALVVPDDKMNDVGGTKVIGADDVQVDIGTIPYEFGEGDGARVLKGKKIEVSKEEGYFYLYPKKPVQGSQMVVSFDDFHRVNEEGKDIGDFYFKAGSGHRTAAANNKKNNQTIAGIKDYDLNLGYYEDFRGRIKVTFKRTGTYTYDKIYISAMSAANYDTFAKARLDAKYDIDSYSSESVSGRVDMEKEGFVFFSIPAYTNWEVYVDGQKTEPLTKANITFMAVHAEKGSHEIVLKHKVKHQDAARWVSLGALLAAVIIAILHAIFSKRRRGRDEKGDNVRYIRPSSLWSC